ncbi:helix-turn-helix transcriptional regulator [Acidithiobacillus ferriphilus]|uniref:helix-turn-helix transcriptional regulator n=1 Tax=Acidithiobacillus ferriphilus TaxID=1689834 RepID=UPI00390C71D9
MKCLSAKTVCSLMSISISTLYRWLNPASRYYDPSFPKPIATGRRKRCYLESAIHDWLRKKGPIDHDHRGQTGEDW